MTQTIPAQGNTTVTATRTLFSVDLEVRNAEGESIATVVLPEAAAWELLRNLGHEIAGLYA